MIAIESQALYQRPILTPDLEKQADDLFRPHVESSVAGDGNQTIPFRKIIELAGETIEQLHITAQRKDQISIATSLLWERYVLMLQPDDPRRQEYDIQVYNSCQHGVLLEAQDWIIKTEPNAVFGSDITGSTFEGDTKVIYYNGIINKARILAGDSASLEEFNEKIKGNFDTTWDAIKESFFELHKYLWRFEGRNDGYISQQSDSWTPVKISEWVFAQLQSGMNHGYWMGGLERKTREKILTQIEEQTKTIISANDPIENRMHYVVGNWDMSESLEIIKRGKKSEKDPGDSEPIETPFSTIGYLNELGKKVYTQITAVETPATVTIVAPFLALRNRTVEDFPTAFGLDNPEVQTALHLAEEARKKGKLIVVYAHASLEHLGAKSDNGDVAKNFLQLLQASAADLAVYPHEHQRLKTKESNIIDVNSHQVYQYFENIAAVSRFDRGTSLVTDPGAVGKDDQLVTVYLPYLNDAETGAQPRTAIGIYPVNPRKAARRNILRGIGGLAPQVL